MLRRAGWRGLTGGEGEGEGEEEGPLPTSLSGKKVVMVMVMVATLAHPTAHKAFEDTVGSARCNHGGVTGSA